MSENVTKVTDSSFQSDVIEASKTQPVMVDFWAEWCRPCLILAPTVDEVARDLGTKIKIVKMNVDENMDYPGRFNVRSIPTLLVFKGGQVVDQMVGVKSKEEIGRALQRHL